jgi:hypothetical protein
MVTFLASYASQNGQVYCAHGCICVTWGALMSRCHVGVQCPLGTGPMRSADGMDPWRD